jgi:hypothetical protein
MFFMKDSGFAIQCYTQKELASLYRCSTKTFRNWLLRQKVNLGPRIGRCYSPKQVRVIVERLGEP